MNTYQDDLVLYHHGIKGQKWGVRRYQNEDGSLTSAGKKRYNGADKTSGVKPKRGLRALRERIREEHQRQMQEDAILRAEVRSLDTREIQERINRLRLERDYMQLVNASKPKTAPSQVLQALADTSKNLKAIIDLGNAVAKIVNVGGSGDDKKKKKSGGSSSKSDQDYIEYRGGSYRQSDNENRTGSYEHYSGDLSTYSSDDERRRR